MSHEILEIIKATKYSGKSADSWSLGIIFYTIVCGYLPFDEDNETVVQKKIVDLDFKIPEFLSAGNRVFLTQRRH